MPSFSEQDLRAIKLELTTNPMSLSGYLPLTEENDAANADALNQVRAALLVDRYSVPSSQLAFDHDEFNGISPADREWIALMTRDGSVNPAENKVMLSGMLAIFGAGTVTREKLLEVFREPANRIEYLYRAGVLNAGGEVTPSHVAIARQLA